MNTQNTESSEPRSLSHKPGKWGLLTESRAQPHPPSPPFGGPISLVHHFGGALCAQPKTSGGGVGGGTKVVVQQQLQSAELTYDCLPPPLLWVESPMFWVVEKAAGSGRVVVAVDHSASSSMGRRLPSRGCRCIHTCARCFTYARYALSTLTTLGLQSHASHMIFDRA